MSALERPGGMMRRVGAVVKLDFVQNLTRPLILILLLVLLVTAWGLTSGGMHISSGDASVGGNRAWLTSEHAVAFVLSLITLLFYGFFAAVAAGMSIPRDEELKVGEVLHSTGLGPGEYVWGKFAAVVATFVVVLTTQVAAMMFFYHLFPYADADKIRGPFLLASYLKPALVFALPTILFVVGVSFALGERTRKPILVFFFPVALFLFCIFFLWDWAPAWLDPRIDRALALVDPAGFRWLNQVHLKVDRGTTYYNHTPVAYDLPFLLSRVAFVGIAFAAVATSVRHFRRTLRGAISAKSAAATGSAAAPSRILVPDPPPLASLVMRHSPTSFFQQAFAVARFEFRNLAASPGLYLFAPLILFETIPEAYFAVGPTGTWMLTTPGNFAVHTLNTLTLCLCLLLLFYTAESLDRETAAGLAPIFSTTPVRTGAVLFGKALANCFVAVVILFAAWLSALVILLLQGKVAMDLLPFGLVWGLLLGPTLLVWSSFVLAVLALTRSKYATYGISLGVLILSGVLQFRGKMNWVGNWNIWSAVRWSDLGILEPNALPLLLNRIGYTSLAIFFIALAVKVWERREFDATRIVHRLMPANLFRSLRSLLLFALVPIALAITLGVMVFHGFHGTAVRDREKDYWKQNLATWKDVPQAAIAHVDLDLSFEPARHHFRMSGSYDLFNIDDAPMPKIALTLGHHIREVTWTMNGKPCVPENRTNLFVFTPPAPLAKGDHVTIGFRYEADMPDGISKNGGGLSEFIERSGVVLTSFTPSFAPTIGWNEEIGVDPKENSYEPKVYPDDHYKGTIRAAFGSRIPFTTKIRIDGPAEYTWNSVGTKSDEKVNAGRRQVTWTSDHPVSMFNVVAGKWSEKKGTGTAIFHHPAHTYNVDSMLAGLDASRRWYGEWFYPFPWQELKLSEFANLASYAQGFATDITFSEGIGFLTRDAETGHAAFAITAHEAAHQWWGNILVPGEGPGGNILSEGMAHFSTALLHQQVLGDEGRIEFLKRIEERYGESRQVDAERPMIKIDGAKNGDTTVTYDKGGWVFYMLHRLMGHDANLAGLQAFIRNHLTNPDHPLLEDFVEEMRPFAPDKSAYDTFVKQWFFEVAVPEFKFADVKKVKGGKGWIVTGTVTNKGTALVTVEVAARKGDRFEKPARREELVPSKVSKDYADARAPITLGAGKSESFRIECPFEPAEVVADPDALVLQLKRKDALARL